MFVERFKITSLINLIISYFIQYCSFVAIHIYVKDAFKQLQKC